MASVMHSGDIHSFIYAVSFYIGLIMLISMSAPRNGSMSLLFKWIYGSWVYFDGERTWNNGQGYGIADFPLAECLRLHFGALCWYQALFEGIVETANAACTPLRPSSLQLDIARIPSVNMAKWWLGTCCTTSCYSLQPALLPWVNCPLSTII